MNKLERDALRDQLEAIAARLEAAPASTSEAARTYEKRAPGAECAYQSGALEEVCRQESAALRVMIRCYLEPRRRKAA